ncbi:hypothetical protein FSP39_004680 [Pinctada imbricata]|uniref:Carbohydrate sulfotransferase n=1 Tax=Pinctada imbricata TaxID=66713 RepID=A0AA88YMF5_PINIB|nr:hypothetical protein FSP39_004680 [Pinctada imbricata]
MRNVQLFTKKRLGLNYCKVPKAGSTFWMNFFLILDGIYRETDIYRKARYEIHETADNRLEEQNSLGSINDKDVTVMIVRDPYQRLFSAYMDKIFIPLYIEDAKAIARLRNRKCYRENSFQDFLDYVTRDDDVTLNEGQDVHWSPIYYICLPCNIPYNVIIKSEHFSSEVGGLLKSLNLTSSAYELFSKMLNSQNIEVSVQVKVREILRLMLYYDFKNKTCMTYIETMERVWTSFKAQGYMCDEVPFPPVFRNMYYFKIEETIQIILDAIRSCHMTSSQRIKQRMVYLSKAYRAISYNTTIAIRRYFAPDFLLFNYSQVPPI